LSEFKAYALSSMHKILQIGGRGIFICYYHNNPNFRNNLRVADYFIRRHFLVANSSMQVSALLSKYIPATAIDK